MPSRRIRKIKATTPPTVLSLTLSQLHRTPHTITSGRYAALDPSCLLLLSSFTTGFHFRPPISPRLLACHFFPEYLTTANCHRGHRRGRLQALLFLPASILSRLSHPFLPALREQEYHLYRLSPYRRLSTIPAYFRRRTKQDDPRVILLSHSIPPSLLPRTGISPLSATMSPWLQTLPITSIRRSSPLLLFFLPSLAPLGQLVFLVFACQDSRPGDFSGMC